MTTRVAVILAGAFIAGAVLHGGIYSMVAAGAGEGGQGYGGGTIRVYRFNRFTGAVAQCDGPACIRVIWGTWVYGSGFKQDPE